MSEERRRARKKESILKGIIHAIVGFACILVWLLPLSVSTTVPRTELSYILSVLCVCVLGVVSCYWALQQFLDAYKERDALMGVALIADFHIGHFQGNSSLVDAHMCKSYIRSIADPEKKVASKILPNDAGCNL